MMTVNLTMMCVLMVMTAKNVYGKNYTIVKDIRRSLALDILLSRVLDTRNVVIATLPLQLSLTKLASVARGTAKDELMKGLGFANDSMVKTFYKKFRHIFFFLTRGDLTYVNKIYVDDNKNIDPRFVRNSTLFDGVHVDKVDCSIPTAAFNFINRGISTATYRRVESVVNVIDINGLTSLMLIVAGHFKPTWDKRFYSALTKTRPFHLFNNRKVAVPMMSQVDEFQFYDAKDFQVIIKALGYPGCSVTFVRPDYLSLDILLEKLSEFPDTLRNIRKKMGMRLLKLELPRMKIKSEIDLDEFLQKEGIKDIFNSESTGLNAILKERVNTSNVFVSKVRQKLFIEVDEFGISRAERDFGQQDDKEFPGLPEIVFDRPFLFTVNLEFWSPPKNNPTDTYELFTGVYYGPEDHSLRQ